MILILPYSTVRHFADDKNKSLKQIKKHLNLDLRHLCKWLRANKISLNSSKTEMLLFRHPKRIVNYDLKIKIDGKRLIPSEYVKYLGLILDAHLNWKFHLLQNYQEQLVCYQELDMFQQTH